ncbi:MAG: GntR family transcriptional regulator [Candidatus Rokubacteria bacterium]|nr:GntR family transcriptional regulator [Candidatus Rokubacteria bacterium]
MSAYGIGPSSARFLYQKVAAEIRRRIRAGIYQPGARISTESELVREFGVSAITVRRAVHDLAVEGLLVSRQGLGVFVTDPRRIVRSLGERVSTSLAEDMRRSGAEPGLKQLSLVLVPADERLGAMLRVPPGSLVYRQEKVILADGEPVGSDATYLARELGELFGQKLAEDFIFGLLATHDVGMDHIDFSFEGGAVSDDESAVLGLPVGFPLLVVLYTAVRADGSPLLTGRSIARSDRFVYTFCAHPEVHRRS